MRTIFFIFLLLFSLILSSTPVFAHMLKTDGTIGAVIHIDPDDSPFVKESSEVFFELKDTRGKLKPENCDCIVSLQEGSEVLDEKPLFHDGEAGNLSHAAVAFIFPQKGIYTIALNGTPKTEGDFEPFALTYDIRVEREREGTGTPQLEQTKVSLQKFLTILFLFFLIPSSIAAIYLLRKIYTQKVV